MREIKFRAWEITKLMNGTFSKRMITNDNLLMFGDIPSPMIAEGWIDAEPHEGEQWVWMQYTGLKDKNGKEIYEGDIVRHHKYGFNWQVIYSPKNTGYDLINPEHESMHLCDLCQPNLETIGNIYENPELLKG